MPPRTRRPRLIFPITPPWVFFLGDEGEYTRAPMALQYEISGQSFCGRALVKAISSSTFARRLSGCPQEPPQKRELLRSALRNNVRVNTGTSMAGVSMHVLIFFG